MVNLFDWIKKSSYGTAQSIYVQLFGPTPEKNINPPADTPVPPPPVGAEVQPVEEIKLPKIIVIGSETSGKSTLLEGITNRKFFPQHFKTCTKCPIFVKMINSQNRSTSVTWRGDTTVTANDEEVRTLVNDIMKSLVDYVDDILTITMNDPDLPNVEFCDLPGLVAIHRNPEIPAKIEKMVDEFNDKDTLILCVVPASSTNLKGNLAIAKVIKLGKLDKSILCLTMCDTVNSQLVEYCIVERLLVGEEITALHNEGSENTFAGVVATAHLEQKDRAMKEKAYFDNVCQNLDSKYQPNIPDLKTYMGSTNVLRLLDELFHNHMNKVWCPNVLRRIALMIGDQRQQLKTLGTKPSLLTPSQIWNEVSSKLPKQAILDALHGAIVTKFISFRPNFDMTVNRIDGINPLSQTTIEQNRKFRSKLDEVGKSMLIDDNDASSLISTVADSICSAITRVFEAQENSELMIKRFDNYKKKLLELVKNLLKEEKTKQEDLEYLRTALIGVSGLISTTLFTYAELWNNIQNQALMIYSSRAMTILDELKELANGMDQTILVESEDISTLRKNYNARLKMLKNRYRKIRNLKTKKLDDKEEEEEKEDENAEEDDNDADIEFVEGEEVKAPN